MPELEDLKLRDFILLLLRGIEQDPQLDRLTGRTMAQKIIFLLTKSGPLRSSLGLNYRMHYYGPYSREVTQESENLITFGLVDEVAEEFPDLTRYDLQLTAAGRERANKLYNSLNSNSKSKIERITSEAVELNRTMLDQVVSLAYEQAEREGLR